MDGLECLCFSTHSLASSNKLKVFGEFLVSNGIFRHSKTKFYLTRVLGIFNLKCINVTCATLLAFLHHRLLKVLDAPQPQLCTSGGELRVQANPAWQQLFERAFQEGTEEEEEEERVLICGTHQRLHLRTWHVLFKLWLFNSSGNIALLQIQIGEDYWERQEVFNSQKYERYFGFMIRSPHKTSIHVEIGQPEWEQLFY